MELKDLTYPFLLLLLSIHFMVGILGLFSKRVLVIPQRWIVLGLMSTAYLAVVIPSAMERGSLTDELALSGYATVLLFLLVLLKVMRGYAIIGAPRKILQEALLSIARELDPEAEVTGKYLHLPSTNQHLEFRLNYRQGVAQIKAPNRHSRPFQEQMAQRLQAYFQEHPEVFIRSPYYLPLGLNLLLFATVISLMIY